MPVIGQAFPKIAILLAALASAAPGWSACSLGKVAELPVMMAGRKPLVRAAIDGREVPLIVDSGALLSMVTTDAAKALALATVEAPEALKLHGVGGQFSFRLTTVKRFELGERNWQNVDLLVGGSEADAAGLVGQDLLATGDTEYDLGVGRIRFYQPGGCSAAQMGYWAKRPATLDVEPVSGRARHIIGTVYLNGQKLRAAFDTGAARTVISLEAAARAGFRPGGPGVTAGGTGIGLGQRSVQAWILPGATLRIGDEEIRSAGLRIADIGSIGLDMLIAADFFMAHRVMVANSQRGLVFSYGGGPIFDVMPEKVMVGGSEWRRGSAVAELADAEAYASRAVTLLARRDADGAIADLDRAVALRPGEALYYFVRAQARLARGEALLARADLDAALQRKPDYAEARLMRANLAVVGQDVAAARKDLEAVSNMVPREADLRLSIAASYVVMEDWAGAVGQFDSWIATHGEDRRRAEALNGRCWGRAMLNRDLPQALADCDEAVRLVPQAAQLRDSRAMVRLRMGDVAGAIADYDAALAATPDIPWSLFGRGLAKRRSGRDAEGKADIAAAIQRDPRLPEKARKIGLIGSIDDPR